MTEPIYGPVHSGGAGLGSGSGAGLGLVPDAGVGSSGGGGVGDGRRSEVGKPGLDPDPVEASFWELSSDWGTASSTARHLPGYKTEVKAIG